MTVELRIYCIFYEYKCMFPKKALKLLSRKILVTSINKLIMLKMVLIKFSMENQGTRQY